MLVSQSNPPSKRKGGIEKERAHPASGNFPGTISVAPGATEKHFLLTDHFSEPIQNPDGGEEAAAHHDHDRKATKIKKQTSRQIIPPL